jgi:hypothetical protein
LGQIAGDPASKFPEAIPLLLETERQQKPFVSRLLCKLAPKMVDRLLALDKVDIIVRLMR